MVLSELCKLFRLHFPSSGILSSGIGELLFGVLCPLCFELFPLGRAFYWTKRCQSIFAIVLMAPLSDTAKLDGQVGNGYWYTAVRVRDLLDREPLLVTETSLRRFIELHTAVLVKLKKAIILNAA